MPSLPQSCGRWLAWAALVGCVALAVASPALAQGPVPEGPRLRELTATGEGREMYPPFRPDVHHYAVGCDTGALTLGLSAADPETRMTVNGVRVAGPDAVVELTELTGDSDVVIDLRDGKGGSASWTVHCLPANFPTVEARKSPDASDILIAARVGRRYIAIFDTNGVPRFHRRTTRATWALRYHADGLWPYSYSLIADSYSPITGNSGSATHIVLDWDLKVVDVVRVVPPLTHTNFRAFIIKPNGNYVLTSHEPSRRDMSAARDADGNPYGATEPTMDSVIQEITPDGEQVFLWNSWDWLAVLQDCTQHRFPMGYAHINSVQVVDGDIVASFRGCSQVLRIDGASGDVVWMLGRSNLGDADWIARGAPAPLKIVGDPLGEFCGQHAPRLQPDGRLVLFDNGTHCLVDPATGTSERESGAFSRVVEYALDPRDGQAVFQRHHSLHGAFNRLGDRYGHVELLDNGNWLIGWGDAREDGPWLLPDVSITELNPATGEELLSIAITDDEGRIQPTAAWPLPPDALERRPTRALTRLEPGWNAIVWRGRDGVSLEEVVSDPVALGRVAAIASWDAESRSWLTFYPDSPSPLATNTLSRFQEGRTYRVLARGRGDWVVPAGP